MKVIFKKWLVVFFSCCFVATILSGQSLTQDDLVKTPDQLIESELNGNGNEAYLNQIGNRNEVGIIQELNGASSQNLVKVLQVGNLNDGFVSQKGSLNQTVLIQNGNRNNYSLDLEGSDNTFVIIQDGRRNTITQELTNASNNYIELIQQGNDNEITHNQDGLVNQSIVVKQVGDGLRMTINQSGN